MKKLVCITMFGLFSIVQAMEELAERAIKTGVAMEMMNCKIQLPSAEDLKKVFDQKYFTSLAEQTKIHVILSNRRLFPVEIYQEVDVALGTCTSYMNEAESAWLLDINRGEIVEAILEKHPAAIKELQNKGYL